EHRADATAWWQAAPQGATCPAARLGPRGLRRPGLPRGGDGRHRRACRCLQAGAVPALPRQDGPLPRAARAVLRPDHRRDPSRSGLDAGQQAAGAGDHAGVLRLRGERAGRVPARLRVRPHQRAAGPGAGRPGHRGLLRGDREGHPAGHRPPRRSLEVARRLTGGNGSGQRPVLVGGRRRDRPVRSRLARRVPRLAGDQPLPALRRAGL
ncbi:MAG: Transcriptional regulator, AcrR family, partial [uncultured Nocardioidaceae bacterium]